MAFLSPAASRTPIKQPDSESWLTSIGRKLPGMVARAGGTVGGAALGGGAGPVGIAAAGAGGTIAAEPVASGIDAMLAAPPEAPTGGDPTTMARALASRRNSLLNRYRANFEGAV